MGTYRALERRTDSRSNGIDTTDLPGGIAGILLQCMQHTLNFEHCSVVAFDFSLLRHDSQPLSAAQSLHTRRSQTGAGVLQSKQYSPAPIRDSCVISV